MHPHYRRGSKLLDINLFWVNTNKSEENQPLPGLIAMTSPKKAARGREGDVLIALMQLSGKETIAGESLNIWLNKKCRLFYKTAGTVTFAMKTLVDSLNSDLLARNLKRTKGGERLNAAFSLAVIRRETLYLVNIGAARGWYAAPSEVLEISDTDNQGRGLGINQTPVCRFTSRAITENDFFVLSCQPPLIWRNETFMGCTGLSSEAIGRRMSALVISDFQAVMIRMVAGKGIITQTPLILQLGNTTKAAAPSARQTQEPSGSPTSIAQPVEGDSDKPVKMQGKAENAESVQLVTEAAKSDMTEADKPSSGEGKDQKLQQQTNAKTEGTVETRPSTKVQAKVGELTQKTDEKASQTKSWFQKMLEIIMPGITDEPIKLSRGALITIAISVPVAIALIAGAVYVKVGASQQFNQNLIMAQQYAMQAATQLDNEPLKLASLQQSIFWLDKAESYGESDASDSLRLNVQSQLDDIQGIQRLEMIEAVPGGLRAGSDITQIVATTTDLYLLDSTSGTVKHYYMENSGYVEDKEFDCGPNQENPLNTLGNIVDIIPLNENNTFKASLFALDSSGNTEFCIPGEAGVISSLTSPDQGWKKLTAATIDGSSLYILDSEGRAVYRYEGDGVTFDSKPTLFFDDQIPSVTDAIDIEVNGDELYLLRSNGEMVECTYSHMKDYKETQCQDPAPYGDMRDGQLPQVITFPEANFIQMRMTAAPDSSIYLLDANAKALYHFSLQRNLQKVLHPRDATGSDLERLTPTAVAVSSARIVFMAFGNQIYYAQMP
jgi:hypothetical protein